MLRLLMAAAMTFDSTMTEEETKETGLAKLTIEERMALREWIEERYAKKLIAQNKGSSPILQEVLKGGRFIRLSDNTLWEIDVQGMPITQSWITPVEIKVASNSSADYPYTLTNMLTGSTVKARKAQIIK